MKRFVIFIIFLIFSMGSIADAENTSRRVLFISSYHPAFPTFNQQIDGIKSVFDRENILLDIEFMDTKRFPGAESVKSFHNMISFKLKKLPVYDAVIVADDAALLYAVSQSNGLFKNIPVFFCGVNDIDKAASLENSLWIRGVVEAVSMRETLDLIRNIFPERNKLTIITDGTITGQADLKNLLAVVKNFNFTIDILSLKSLTFEELNLRLKNQRTDHSILLLSAYTDSTGSTRLFYDEFSEIYRNSHVPIFHLYEHGMGKGVFGGKLIRHYDQGREAADLALRYFHGTPVKNISNVKESPNRYSFDYNELKIFNVSLSSLPEGSLVINKPLSFYESHKILAITFILIMAALLYVVVILVIEGRRLRVMVRERTKELAESEERWKFSMEGAGQVVWDWDIQIDKIFISQKWNEMFGSKNKGTFFDTEDWLNQIHEDDRGDIREIMDEHLSGVKPHYEKIHRVITKNGSIRWVLSRGKVFERLPDGKPKRVIGTATDITKLKQIEDEINRSRRMLKLVLDTIPIGVFWKNTDLTYLGCNNLFARLIGIESAESIVGKKDDEILDIDLARSYNIIDREILSSGKPKLNYEDQLFLPTGKVRILRKSKVPLTGENGEVIGVLGTYEDITVQKNLMDETFRIQKLESVGILASGIAHDFNNLLMAISGTLSVLRLSPDLSEKNLHWIEQAEKSCFTATELTTRLITFSRGGAPILQQENIVEIIKEALGSGSGSQSVSVNYSNESPLTSMMMDGRQMRQVFINIIENAKEAMPDGGSVDITSSSVVIEQDNRFELKPGKYMMISIKDTGPGIPDSIIDKIFDPYFSTKEMGPNKGQGLGLAICHSIIAQHGGKITVNSIPGKGALFTIYIPFSRS